MEIIDNRQPAPVAAVPKINFEKYGLENGLEVILSVDHRLPIVAVNIWYHVGPSNPSTRRERCACTRKGEVVCHPQT